MRSTEARYANASDRGNGGRCCRVGDGQHRDLPHPSLLASVSWGRVPTMLGHMKLSDSTLVIVLHNGEQEIERELAPPADALRVALMMLVRRRRLEIGDVLEVMARTERRWGGVKGCTRLTRRRLPRAPERQLLQEHRTRCRSPRSLLLQRVRRRLSRGAYKSSYVIHGHRIGTSSLRKGAFLHAPPVQEPR
jgi:hypothetical protein